MTHTNEGTGREAMRKASVVIWLPVIWETYQLDALPALIALAVLFGLFEVFYRTPYSRLTVAAAVHMAGLSLIMVMPGKEALFLLSVVIVHDAASFLGGKLLCFKELRRHPFPLLSPNKTVGGYISGIVAGTFVGIVIGNYLNFSAYCGLLTLPICFFAVGGDLLNSKFKRFYEIKDSGDDLPTRIWLYGNGGVYDFFDAIALVCIVWYSVNYFLRAILSAI